MIDGVPVGAVLPLVLHVGVELAVIVRVPLRPHRQPASRIAWIVVIITLPVAGIVAYLLVGEVSIGRRHVSRHRDVLGHLREWSIPAGDEANLDARVPERYGHLFRVGRSISGFVPVGGNSARLLADSNAAIDAMVADIDAAQDHVHLLFYIWLSDRNGCKIVEALKRAVGRGVHCRAMADDLGSRIMIHSAHWQAMRSAGVEVAVALPIGNPLLRPFNGRIDVRNHRKIVVVDGRITYCGSQNCADPEFRIKPKFAPWVDAMVRFEGPVAAQNQRLFASDWMTYADEDLTDLLRQPIPTPGGGSPHRSSVPVRPGATRPCPRCSNPSCTPPVASSSSPPRTTSRTSPCRPHSVPVPTVGCARPSSFRPATTPGSWGRRAGATMASCSRRG
jgi:cardiolipin synthase